MVSTFVPLTKQKSVMEITERDLEDLIFTDLSEEPLNVLASGLKLRLLMGPNDNVIHWHRQVDLRQYGRADIIGYSRNKGRLEIDIIELKNRPLKCEDFEQIFRYKQGVQELIYNKFRSVHPIIYCYLIGAALESGHFMQNNCACSVYTFNFSLRGFSFQYLSGGWRLGDGKLNGYSSSDKATTPAIYRYGEVQESTDGILG
jgi:hypothetical protein